MNQTPGLGREGEWKLDPPPPTPCFAAADTHKLFTCMQLRCCEMGLRLEIEIRGVGFQILGLFLKWVPFVRLTRKLTFW